MFFLVFVIFVRNSYNLILMANIKISSLLLLLFFSCLGVLKVMAVKYGHVYLCSQCYKNENGCTCMIVGKCTIFLIPHIRLVHIDVVLASVIFFKKHAKIVFGVCVQIFHFCSNPHQCSCAERSKGRKKSISMIS